MEWPIKKSRELIIVRHGECESRITGNLTEKGKSQLLETASLINNLDIKGNYISTLSSIEMRAVNTALFLRDKLFPESDKQPNFTSWLFTHPYLCDQASTEHYKQFIDFMNSLVGGNSPFLLVAHNEFMETFPFRLYRDVFGEEILSRENNNARFGYGEGIFINSSGDYKPIIR